MKETQHSTDRLVDFLDMKQTLIGLFYDAVKFCDEVIAHRWRADDLCAGLQLRRNISGDWTRAARALAIPPPSKSSDKAEVIRQIRQRVRELQLSIDSHAIIYAKAKSAARNNGLSLEQTWLHILCALDKTMTFRQLESATIEQVKRINQESNYVPHSRADLSADNGTGITYLNYRMRTETNQDIIEHLSNLRNRTLPNETPSQALARGIEQTLRLGMNAHSLIKLGVTEALTHIYKPAANTNNQIDATSEKTVQQTTQTAHEIANHILGLAHRDSNECTCKTACTCIDPQWMWNRMRSPYLVVTLGQLLKASTTPLRQFGSIAELVDDVCNNVGAYVVYDEFTRQPLDAGSLVRFSPTLHRMIRAREQSVCAHPDCDTPAEYCEANHIRPWIEGGPTGVNNIVMVCTHHHRQLTNGEAEVHLEADGTIIWRNWRTGFYAKQQKIGRVQEVFTKLFEETSPANAIEDNSSTKKIAEHRKRLINNQQAINDSKIQNFRLPKNKKTA